MPSSSKTQFGQDGEELAVGELKRLGYQILERNVRTKLGELDVVALDGDTVCFIEVKTRRSVEQGEPLEAVSFFKRRKLARLAVQYLKAKNLTERSARFDVASVMVGDAERGRVEILSNAFDLNDIGFLRYR